METLAALTGVQVLDAQPEYGTARLAVEPGREQAEIGRLRKLPWVRYAEPNYLAWTTTAPQGDTTYPNDPYFGSQWNMRRIGAPEAWAVTFGSNSMVVAVVDSGVDLAHPEFAGQFHDPLLPGYDYVNRDNTPDDDTANSHGTHVTGILAAAANNGIGVAGLAPMVKILPLKVLDSAGSGDYADIGTAIRRAADFNAQIINLSLGGSESSATLAGCRELCSGPECAGCGRSWQLCAGRGVQACGYRNNPDFYPAAYPGVLAVAASDRFDNWAPYAGYKSYVGLAAPGGIPGDAVWSTVRNGYGPLSGTSMAAPLVSGAAALIWTLAPASTPQQVAGILKETADKVGTYPQTGQSIPYVGGRNDYFGAGRLNVGRAVRQAYPPSLTPVTGLQQFMLGGSVTQGERQVLLSNPSSQEITWQATVIEGAAWLSVNPAVGTAKYTGPGTLALRANRGVLTPGVYDGKVRVQTLYVTGIPSFEVPVQLRVSDTTRRTFLPGLAGDWLGGWQDPLAPGGPAAQGLYLSRQYGQPGQSAVSRDVLRWDLHDDVGFGQRDGRLWRHPAGSAAGRLSAVSRGAQQCHLRAGAGLAA